MPGYHGYESEVQWQLRGAGKREALIFDTGINITTMNYGGIVLLFTTFWRRVAGSGSQWQGISNFGLRVWQHINGATLTVKVTQAVFLTSTSC
ncbi:hypothetical protein NDU88_004781 [Pleurodeles waltl]|uniref:Uncharacterized protein n=1 Tax=Pleurodeles waltl TaxID=8319 RepID=A0AAV7W5Y3_PLEWA|nr:hypothetical protein NDU88_004781 [Pleurodeles waltl]